MTEEEKNTLRCIVESALRRSVGLPAPAVETSGALKNPAACFVTLYKNNKLRGCIGNLQPEKPLADQAEENAAHAALRDPRFPPLRPEEVEEVSFSISILSEPRPLPYRDYEQLKTLLVPLHDGVILEEEKKRAVYLPQVWEQLPDPDEFLRSLLKKGGIGGEFQPERIRVSVFRTEEI